MVNNFNLLWEKVIPSIEEFQKAYNGNDFLESVKRLSPGISRLFEINFKIDELNNPSLLEKAIDFACRNAELNGRGLRPDLIDLYFGFIAVKNSKI